MRGWPLKAIISIVLSYPLSGVTFGLLAILRNFMFFIEHPVRDIVATMIAMLWFMIFTPIGLGFAIGDEGGINRVNMYPYIFPTALLVFFTLMGGWKWLREKVLGY